MGKEKKEIGKLLELLNEYGNERYDYWGDYQTFMDFSDRDIYWYLSKKFGFIKWLVENDKIDKSKYEKILDRIEYYSQSDDEKERHYYSDYESLLMLLSISDTPIEDLISYLK